MKKLIYIASACIIMAGCTSLKQGWRNFNAYYNTFYNTKLFYGEGLKKVQSQQPDINTAELITIFPEPVSAGAEDFQLAIERGSSILRSHEDSKYVLPAISIIGNSYFYRSEYFAALEKFRELQILGDDKWKQNGVFWQGLTYFELGDYDEGIRFLENELYSINHPDRNLHAKIYALLGQLYSARGEWDVAAEHLEAAVDRIEEREIRALTYFLLGQVHEEAGRYDRALYAYSRSGEISNHFNLQYNSLQKEAESARRIEAWPRALAIYSEMLRDDKFYEYRNELRYEIGRTRQAYGLTDEALENYRSVLDNRTQPPTTAIRARTYYAIAEIYRYDLNDYTLAAAYYDSAASSGGTAVPDFNADEMAGIFGRYVSTKREIASADSLLQLAELDEEEFEAFVEKLRREEAEKIESELREIQAQRNQMYLAETQDTILEAATSTEHGFLSINNAVNLADASLQFQAVWGDRPLDDNWRRRSAVSGSRFDRPAEAETVDGTLLQLETDQEFGILPQIDVGDVPFTDEQKNAVRKDRENAYYRMGNLFFLSMDEPDSAAVYFLKVAESGYDERLKGMAAYSLAEISLLNEDAGSARFWYEQLREQDPESVFVNRLSARIDSDRDHAFKMTVGDQVVREFYSLEMSVNDHEPVSPQNIAELVQLTTHPDQRALLLFDTAREYMKAARVDLTNESIITDWFERKQAVSSGRDPIDGSTAFLQQPDSSGLQTAPFLSDSSGTPAGLPYADSINTQASPALPDTIASPDLLQQAEVTDTLDFANQPTLPALFPFEGAYWDSTRYYLTRVIEEHPHSAVADQAMRLYTVLEFPQESESLPERDPNEENPAGSDESGMEHHQREGDEIPVCSDLGMEMESPGGIEGFLDSVTFPAWTQNVSMRGEVTYLLTISADGTLAAYEQHGGMERSGIPQAIEEALEDSLIFTSHSYGETVECLFIFPIEL